MLILILINVHFLQNNVCSFEKSWNSQIYSSGSHHPDKKIPKANFPFSSTPYLLSSLSIASDSWIAIRVNNRDSKYKKFNRPDVFSILKLKLGPRFGTKETLVLFLLLKEIFSKKLKLLYIGIYSLHTSGLL